jgi:DNA-binding CsgD family transcriptional regulator/GAF domain-containing protein
MTPRGEQDLVRLCHSGLDVATMQQRVLRGLRTLMSVDAVFFATADPETLLFTSAIAEDPLGSATARFLDNEFGGGDVNTFAALATSPVHVASLDAATRADRGSSPRYREIMRPLGLGDELRAALVTGTTCWGYLCLHRADGPSGFSRGDATLIARLAPHLAHGLRQALLLDRSAVAGDDLRPGVLLLAPDLSVAASTPEAEHLLSLLPDSARGPVPVAVQAVAAALRAAEDSATRPVSRAGPSVRVRTASGSWLDLHASRLQGAPSEHIAVVLEPAGPRVAAAVLLAAHGLSPRETEVARLVLRGASTRMISDALHISPHTVQDHLKAVFDKTGVRSRRDLVGLLLGGAHGSQR